MRFLQVTGRGFGHGRGLGQYGSYGYAVDLGWAAPRILDHYYGGTVAGTLNPPPIQRVRLQSFDGKTVTIVQPKGTLAVGVASLSANGATPSGAVAPVQAGAVAAPGSGSGSGSGSTGDVAASTVPVSAVPVVAAASPPVLPTPGSADTVPTTAPASVPSSPAGAGGVAAASAVALRVQQLGPNRWQLSEGPGCEGPFTPRTVLEGPGVLFTVDPSGATLDPSRNPDPADMIQVCVGSARRAYRGDLVATTEGSTTRLVNVVAMESYLRSVVPAESPPKWADRPNGIEALKAQSVAARSYAAAERRSGAANTCDTTACQVYRGRGEFRGGSFTSFEDTRTDRAIAETAGIVRLWPNGSVVRTEFSSSTGGWTAPGEFPVIADEGDATTANPYRQWTVRLSAERLEAGRNLGSFVGAEVIRRDGTGPDGGRARRVRLTFTGGSVDIASSELSGRFGFRSSYYSLAVMERAAGTSIDVGDVFQPTDAAVAAAAASGSGSGSASGSGSGSGSSAGTAPPDTGPVLAGSPDTAGSGAVAAAAVTTAAPARSTTTTSRRRSSTTTTAPPTTRRAAARRRMVRCPSAPHRPPSSTSPSRGHRNRQPWPAREAGPPGARQRMVGARPGPGAVSPGVVGLAVVSPGVVSPRPGRAVDQVVSAGRVSRRSGGRPATGPGRRSGDPRAGSARDWSARDQPSPTSRRRRRGIRPGDQTSR